MISRIGVEFELTSLVRAYDFRLMDEFKIVFRLETKKEDEVILFKISCLNRGADSQGLYILASSTDVYVNERFQINRDLLGTLLFNH